MRCNWTKRKPFRRSSRPGPFSGEGRAIGARENKRAGAAKFHCLTRAKPLSFSLFLAMQKPGPSDLRRSGKSARRSAKNVRRSAKNARRSTGPASRRPSNLRPGPANPGRSASNPPRSAKLPGRSRANPRPAVSNHCRTATNRRRPLSLLQSRNPRSLIPY